MRWSGWLAAIALSTSAAQTPEPSRAAPRHEPPAQSASEMPDAELLEFLGSLDTEDGELIDDLTDTDVAKPAPTPPALRVPEAKPNE
jgi:hypothetical protein